MLSLAPSELDAHISKTKKTVTSFPGHMVNMKKTLRVRPEIAIAIIFRKAQIKKNKSLLFTKTIFITNTKCQDS